MWKDVSASLSLMEDGDVYAMEMVETFQEGDTICSCSQLQLFSYHNCAVISLLPWEYYC